MPSKLATLIRPANEPVEFETFELRPRLNNKYHFLREMPKGAHYHFTDDHHRIRAAVSQINKRLAKEGIHFSCHKVGEEDPKGPGVRVLHDDKPMPPRA